MLRQTGPKGFYKIETPEKLITFDTGNGIRSLVPHVFKSYRYFKNSFSAGENPLFSNY